MPGANKEERERGARKAMAADLGRWLGHAVRKGFANLQQKQGRRMQLVETLCLGGKRQLMLVQCDGQRVLVGAGSDGICAIAEMREPVTMKFGGLDEADRFGFGAGLGQAEQPLEREVLCN